MLNWFYIFQKWYHDFINQYFDDFIKKSNFSLDNISLKAQNTKNEADKILNDESKTNSKN
jgi:hypothetical protein